MLFGIAADTDFIKVTLDQESRSPDEMAKLNLWICPGCGALMELPSYISLEEVRADTMRLDQLARCLCGCWVVKLPGSEPRGVSGPAATRG
jgi:hypothetical protein